MTPGRLTRRRQQARARKARRRRIALGALVLLVVVLIGVARLLSEHVPNMHTERLVSATIALRGASPKLAWPAQGSAAVEVEGIGSLGTSGSARPVPIASVAKVMTAYLTLREHPLTAGSRGFTITVTRSEVEEERERAALDESVVPVTVGERLSERQTLQALLLPSANNVAALLAIHDAGSIDAFVARMNVMAKRLRMDATKYTDPSGFEDSTVSTAPDLLKLATVAMQIPAFAAIVDEHTARLPVVGRVENYNELAGQEGYVGIKTGSDSEAGGCLLFAKRVTVAGRRLTILGVVLGQREGSYVPAAVASARLLGNSVASALKERVALPAGSTVLLAHGLDGKTTSVVTTSTVREVGWGGMKVHVSVAMRGGRSARLQAGQQVAKVEVLGPSPGSSKAVAMGSLPSASLSWRLSHML